MILVVMVAKIRYPFERNIGFVWDMVWAQINLGSCQQQLKKLSNTSISIVT